MSVADGSGGLQRICSRSVCAAWRGTCLCHRVTTGFVETVRRFVRYTSFDVQKDDSYIPDDDSAVRDFVHVLNQYVVELESYASSLLSDFQVHWHFKVIFIVIPVSACLVSISLLTATTHVTLAPSGGPDPSALGIYQSYT